MVDRSATFADRLWWSRHYGPTAKQAGRLIGATKLARAVGCAQGLISNLEGNNAASSKLNDKFAKALGVDSHWLRAGVGAVPTGFDAERARQRREGNPDDSSLIPLWAADDTDHAHVLSKSIISQFQDYVHVAGPERTKTLLGILEGLGGLVSSNARRVTS